MLFILIVLFCQYFKGRKSRALFEDHPGGTFVLDRWFCPDAPADQSRDAILVSFLNTWFTHYSCRNVWIFVLCA